MLERKVWRFSAPWIILPAVLLGAVWLVFAAEPPLRLQLNEDGSVNLEWDTEPGGAYQVYWNSNAVADLSSWQVLTNLTGTGGTVVFRDLGGPGRAHPGDVTERYYALRLEQATNSVATPIRDDFLDSVTLPLTGSPYIITNDVRVRAGVSVTLAPGVRMLFGPAGRLTVEGELRAEGSPDRPVVFTSSKVFAQPGDWPGLRWVGTNALGGLSNAVVEFAVTGVSVADSSPVFSRVTVRRSREHGFFLERSSSIIRDSIIERNGLDGIRGQNRSQLQILANKIRGNGRHGIALQGANNPDQNPMAIVQRNALYENVQLALDTQNFAPASRVVLNCRSNWWGTATAVEIPPLIADQTDRSNAPWVDWGNWLQAEDGPAMEGTTAFGVVEDTQVWRTSDSPVWVLGPVTVSTNGSLAVERGVDVRVVGNWRIEVAGAMTVGGTESEPVHFTTAHPFPTRGAWLGIRFTDPSVDASCVWSNAVVEFAVRGIECIDASPTLVGITARENSQHGIFLERSSPTIEGGAMESNGQDGIHCTFLSSPRIASARIRFNGSDGIELAGSTSAERNPLPVIVGNSFLRNTAFDLNANNYSRASEVVIQARGNWWGVSSPEEIAARIFDFHDRNTSPWVDWGAPLTSEGGTPEPGTSAIGPVVGDAIWRAADSPVTVVGHVIVSTNASLRIEPGVEIRFLGPYRLDVFGALQALGTASTPVVFTSGHRFPWPGDWEGIRFLDSSIDASCVMSNVIVEFARNGITCADASPTIEECEILENSLNGILLSRSAAVIRQSTIRFNVQDGIHCLSNSTPLITLCAIQGNGSDGIELRGETSADRNSAPQIEGNALEGNLQFALRAANYFQASNVTINARGNWWGSAVPSQIVATVFDAVDAPTSPWVDWGNWLDTDNQPTPGTSAFGTVRTNTTWRTQDSPVWVIGPVTVSSNATLTVQQGVTVRVIENWRLDVSGGLTVNGTTNQPVTFTSAHAVGAPGQWLGVRFNGSSIDAACVWSNAVVEFAQRGIECIDASPTLVGVRSRQNSQHGIYLERSSPLIQGGAFEENTMDGIHCVWRSEPLIIGNRIRGNGSDGLELVGITTSNRNSAPLIFNNLITGNTNFALNANTYFTPTQTVILARSNWWGTADPAQIPVRIFDQLDNRSAPFVDWGNWLLSETGPATPGRSVIGSITNATIWSGTDEPIAVVGPLNVATGVVLRIDPGVHVEFYGTNGLIVEGGLLSLGTRQDPVVFTSGRLAPQAGSWGGIRFTPSSTNQPCVVSNTVIEYAITGVHGQQTALEVVGSHLRRNTTGILLDTTSALVVSNLIELNTNGVHVSDRSQATLIGNTITLNVTHGVNVTPSRASGDLNPTTVLTGNSFSVNGTGGPTGRNLFAGAYSSPASVVINARSNWWSGATDATLIDGGIHHRADSSSSPTVDFADPLETNPNFAVTGNRSSVDWFSPNADGNRDELSVEAQVSHDANWEVTIVDASRVPVARFTGQGRNIAVKWNGNLAGGTAAPEGRYRPLIRATNQVSSATFLSHGDVFQLDRTAPVSSAFIPKIEDGTVIDELEVRGTASDRYFAYYIVDYGIGANPGSFTLVRSNAIPPAELFARLNSRDLENGDYIFRVRAYDLAGNFTETLLPVTIDNLSILDVEAESVFFDPAVAPARVSFDITREADVTFQICRFDAYTELMGDVIVATHTNRILRSTSAHLPPGRQTFTWDGTDSQGRPMTNGLYAFVIRASAELGRRDLYNPEYVAGPVTISNFTYTTNFAFYANEPARVSYTLFAPAFVVLAVQNRPYVVLWGDIRPAGEHHEVWDGRSNEDRSLLYGDFRLGIKPQVLPENALVISRQVSAIVTNLAAESYIFTPTLSEVSEIHYALSRPAEVILQVREPNGGLITLEDRIMRTSGTHKVEWNGAFDGRSLVNVEGDYEVLLTARDSGGQLETRNANVRVRR